MKGMQGAYAPATAAAFEEYNAKLVAIEAERMAIGQDREAIRQDALGPDEKTPALRKRFAACLDRALDVDRRELALLGELPKLAEMARADWAVEAEKHRAAEAERRKVLEKSAAKLELTEAQTHRLILEDKARRGAEQLFKAARVRFSNPNVDTEADKARANELRKAIAGAFR